MKNFKNFSKSNINSSSVKSLMSSLMTVSILGLGYLGGEKMFISGVGLLITNYFISQISSIFSTISRFFHKTFFTSIVLTSEDQSYDWIMEWLSEQKFSKRSNTISVHTSWGKGESNNNYYTTNPYKHNATEPEKQRPTIYFAPALGSHFFFYKLRLIWINRIEKEGMQSGMNVNYYGVQNSLFKLKRESMVITTMGFGGQKYLRNLIKQCMENSFKKTEGKTWIYSCGSPSFGPIRWKRGSSKAIRAMDSVIFPKGVKEELLKDLELFLKSKNWYSNCGVPYRRGYIFFGKAGTGKTSLISALAGYFKMSIAILNIGGVGMRDEIIHTLLDDAPSNSIIVLEDVDVAVLKSKSSKDKSDYDRLSFSGILNSLDGINSGEGRIMIMTTNHVNRLPASLIRPGRIDVKHEFCYANAYQIEKMFLKFYPKSLDISKKLTKIIPENKVSCAELQEYYLLHRNKLGEIVENVDDFLKKIEKERIREQEQIKKEEETTKKGDIDKKDIKNFIKIFSKIKGKENDDEEPADKEKDENEKDKQSIENNETKEKEKGGNKENSTSETVIIDDKEKGD